MTLSGRFWWLSGRPFQTVIRACADGHRAPQRISAGSRWIRCTVPRVAVECENPAEQAGSCIHGAAYERRCREFARTAL